MPEKMYCAHAEQIHGLLTEMMAEGYTLPDAVDQLQLDVAEAEEAIKARNEPEE